ncbi:MAG: polysaccharide biosynthesis protein [Bacteroidia bacterium]|nr:MAG: polysaccharide biosynthesis protein [Bacteroidia bacterium]
MKVLLIAHKNPFPPDDGGKMGIYTMINGLLINKIELDVLIMNPSKVFRPIDKNIVPSEIQKLESQVIDTNIKPHSALLNLFTNQSYFISRFWDKTFEKKLIASLKQTQYDIIQLESIFSAVYLPVIKKYSNAKIILSAHNIEHQIWERVIQHEKNLLKKWYLNLQIKRLKAFEIKLFQEVDGITTVTELDKKNILSFAPNKPIVVTPNGMDMRKFKVAPFEQQDLNTIFFLGSLDWMPNQQGIVWFLDNVWNKVLEKLPDIKLVIAGKNIPEWLLNRKEKNVRYYSNVPDVKELYHSYAIMIVPLLAGSGIRVKIIEGMSFGKCIISTSIGAEGVPYEKNKNIIITDTPEEFAAAIVDCIQHPEKIKQIQQAARQTAEKHYSRESVYLPLVNLYKELLQK